MPSGKSRGIKSDVLKEVSVQKALGEEHWQKEGGKKLRDMKSKNGRRWIRGDPEAEKIY